MRCKPNDLCIVIRSTCGNEGREVTVLRWTQAGGSLPEFLPGAYAGRTGWVTRARDRLSGYSDDRADQTIGVYPDTWLLPLRPEAAPRVDVERETDFAFG